ncbi:MAG: ABC transporter permease [Pseudomonadota bacterium]
MTFVAGVGRQALALTAGVGRAVLFLLLGLAATLRPPFYLRELGQALMRIGYTSLPVVGLTAFFTGAALALQIYQGGARFNAEAVVPSIVAIAMVRELGPVLGGLMVAARVASSIAAEIATMRVTEQIDALVTLSTDPMRYLVAPRLVAGTLALPCLIAVGDAIGILGGWYVGVSRLGFSSVAYLQSTADFLQVWDVTSGLMKGAVFGLIITFTGCFFGMNAGRGAQGVGQATKSAVVTASVLILAANFLLTEAFFAQ